MGVSCDMVAQAKHGARGGVNRSRFLEKKTGRNFYKIPSG